MPQIIQIYNKLEGTFFNTEYKASQRSCSASGISAATGIFYGTPAAGLAPAGNVHEPLAQLGQSSVGQWGFTNVSG